MRGAPAAVPALLTERLAGVPGIITPYISPAADPVYWF